MYVNGEPLKISFESRRDLTGRKTEEHSRERVERRCEEGVLFTLHSGKVLTQKERETNRMRIPLYLERGADSGASESTDDDASNTCMDTPKMCGCEQ